MIIRANRSQSRIKGQEHRQFQNSIEQLQRENQQLRISLLQTQQKLEQSEASRRKYKQKYRDAKQKVQILGLVGLYNNKTSQCRDYCASPTTKATRVKTAGQQEFTSVTMGLAHSQLQEHIETKPYIMDSDDYQTNFINKRCMSPATTAREIEREKDREDPKLVQSLVKIHEQLERMSQQISEKGVGSVKVVALQNQLYGKLQEIVDKLNKMEVRELDRDNKRLARQQQLGAKRHNSAMKELAKIGKDLADFKIEKNQIQ